MGAGISKLSPSRTKLTGNELLLSSSDITKMSNALFEFMYSNWKKRDIMEIANNPSDYVIAVSDLITTQFHVLGYKAKSGKIGEIYFKKWDALEPPLASDKLAEANARNSKLMGNSRNSGTDNLLDLRKKTRKLRSDKNYQIHVQNAEIIAFYFIRIFQILGAMLMVVKDINIPEYDLVTQKEKFNIEPNAAREYATQSYPIQQTIPGFKPVNLPVTRGGGSLFDSSIALGPYEFLRFYLRQIDESDSKKFSEKGISGIDKKNTYILNGTNNLFFRYTLPTNTSEISAINGGKQELGMAVIIDGSPVIKFIAIKISEIRFDTEEPSRFTYGYKPPREVDETRRELIYPNSVTIEYNSSRNNSVTMVRVNEKPSSIINGRIYQFYTDSANLVEVWSQHLDRRKDFTMFLENITLYYLKKANGNLVPIKFEKERRSNSVNDKKYKIEPPSNESLKSTYIEFSKKDYRPHCIARALQLLDLASINNITTKDGITKICSTPFKNLSEYVATRTVGQLFGKINPLDYEKSKKILEAFVKKGSRGDPLSVSDLSDDPTEASELSQAIQRLSTAFNIEFKNKGNFSELEIKLPDACRGRGEETVITGSEKFRNMKSASQELLAYHLKSIIIISKFLQKMFNITQRSDGSWNVEGPKQELMFAGFDALNTITNTARAILIDYYAGCEEIYQRGVQAWVPTVLPKVDVDRKEEAKELPS